jgi:hypothetical protein
MFDRIAANRHYIGYPVWKVAALAIIGKMLGVQFKIFGMPFGAAYNPEIAEKAMGPRTSLRADNRVQTGIGY